MTEQQALCPHAQFTAAVNVARITDIGRFVADVRIRCEDCGLPFSFVGAPAGFDYNHPTVNVDATEINLPIRPGAGGVIERMHHMGWPWKGEKPEEGAQR